MPAEWSEADSSVVHMIMRLVEDYHPDLRAAKIGVIFRSEPSKSQGNEVWAKAEKVNAKWRSLLGVSGLDELHFLIWIAKDVWERIDARMREALLDHELQHCYLVGDEPKMRGHDFEEFRCIVERRGLWNHGLFGAKEAFQLALSLEGCVDRVTGNVIALKSRGAEFSIGESEEDADE